MKIDIDEQGNLVAKEVLNSLILETAEGNQVAVCMRDDTIELCVMGSDQWYRADIELGTFEKL